ncbi:hypothetical protein [Pedobacter gandavensis]|nr:hypothetical protein [Pedobacter gandavensis]
MNEYSMISCPVFSANRNVFQDSSTQAITGAIYGSPGFHINVSLISTK